VQKSALDLNPTVHAVSRWMQRFPDYAMRDEFVSSKPLGRGKLRKRILAGLRGKARQEMKGPFTHCYYLYAKRSGAVFVMTKPSVVITVLKMPELTGEERSNG
jgi:hypothetical protein